MEICVRRATPQDAREIWLWRNDEHSREMSLDQSVIPWENHVRWYDCAMQNPDRLLFVGEMSQTKIGMCRFDVNRQASLAEVSINLNPVLRGSNLSVPFLRASIRLFHIHFAHPILARIRDENFPSLRCFKNCGFELIRQEAGYGEYMLAKLDQSTLKHI